MQANVLADVLGILQTKAGEYGGDNTGLVPDILVALYGGAPDLERVDDYPYVVRIVEKLLRISRGKGNMKDAWQDIIGYATRRLTHMMREGCYHE